MLSTAVNVIPRFRDNIKTAIEIRDQSLPADSILSSLPPTNLVDVTGVPRACGLLSEWELHITEDYDAVDLVGLLKAQKVTSLALVKAFRKRASIAQQLVSSLSPSFPGPVAGCLLSRVCADHTVLISGKLRDRTRPRGTRVGRSCG